MVSVDTADEEMWRFIFDKDGVVTIPAALSPEQVSAMREAPPPPPLSQMIRSVIHR